MAKWILHTVGPIYNEKRKNECEELLRSCYKNSIALALLNECQSIAFPLISVGVYGYPKAEALDIAVSCIQRFADEMDTVIVLFDAEAYEIAKRNYSELIA